MIYKGIELTFVIKFTLNNISKDLEGGLLELFALCREQTIPIK